MRSVSSDSYHSRGKLPVDALHFKLLLCVAAFFLLTTNVATSAEPVKKQANAFDILKKQDIVEVNRGVQKKDGAKTLLVLLERNGFPLDASTSAITIPLTLEGKGRRCEPTLPMSKDDAGRAWWVFEGPEPVAIELSGENSPIFWKHDRKRGCFRSWPMPTASWCEDTPIGGKQLIKLTFEVDDGLHELEEDQSLFPKPVPITLPVVIEGGEKKQVSAEIGFHTPGELEITVTGEAAPIPEMLLFSETMADGAGGKILLFRRGDREHLLVIEEESFVPTDTRGMDMGGRGYERKRVFLWSPTLHQFVSVFEAEETTVRDEDDFDESVDIERDWKCHTPIGEGDPPPRLVFSRREETASRSHSARECDGDDCPPVCETHSEEKTWSVEWHVDLDETVERLTETFEGHKLEKDAFGDGCDAEP